jgi:aryl-alcohol dehydrogenase-like predicted oxidoreductase
VNFIDTADEYSSGLAETEALKSLALPRDSFVLATKVLGGMGPGANQSGLSRVHILQTVDASLKRLRLDYIDLYQIHGRDPLTSLEEVLDALDACVRSGKVRYIGLRNPLTWEIAARAVLISIFRRSIGSARSASSRSCARSRRRMAHPWRV